jgi:hypothetical protein
LAVTFAIPLRLTRYHTLLIIADWRFKLQIRVKAQGTSQPKMRDLIEAIQSARPL